MTLRTKWWRFRTNLVLIWHKHQCKRGKHVWRLHKTTVGHYINGRYYKICTWCGKEDWDIAIDKEHQK